MMVPVTVGGVTRWQQAAPGERAKSGMPQPAPARTLLMRHAFGAALRETRTANGMTLRATAAAARMSIGYLSEVERGGKEASSEIYAAVCGALGITVVDLLCFACAKMDGGAERVTVPDSVPEDMVRDVLAGAGR